MGSNLSKSSICASLIDRTKDDIASGIVEQLGSVYAPYSERIVQHNISGAVLWSFRKELYDETHQNLIQNILINDLGVTNSIHQRVLHLEFVKLIQHEEEICVCKEDRHEIPTNIVIQKPTASDAINRPFIANKSKAACESTLGIDFLEQAPRKYGPPKRHQQYSTDSLETEKTIATAVNTSSSSSSSNDYSEREFFQQQKEANPSVSQSPNNFVENGIILRGFGPIHDVTQFDVMQYESSPTLTSNGPNRQRTAMLPIFHNEFSANREENTQYKEHLPENYYKTLDELQIDHTPIHIHDAERVALVESFSLRSITPSDPTGVALRRLTVCL
jgi:hypothetical protein